jgi:uncharacterized repeat protein (TIGR02543 family)
VVDSNGRVYVIGYTGFGENHLFAFDANGSLAWDTNSTSSPLSIGGLVDSSLALDQNGTLFFGCFDNRVYAVNVGTGLADSPWPQFKRGNNRNGAWPSFLVEVGLSPSGAGEVNGSGIYNQGATATLSVSSNINDGYSFGYWSGDQACLSNPLTFRVNSHLNITANFNLNSYLLEVNSGIGGTATGSTSLPHGSLAPISASTSPGYSFSGWTGAGINNSLSPSTFVTMNQDQNVTALFSRIMLSSKILAEGREHNWYESTWFGSFYESASGWCYHSDLGWIYPYFSENSFWIWSSHLKWLWISSSTYTNSFAWSENEKNWIYLDLKNSSGPRIYSYQKTAWQGFTIE